MMSYSMVVSQKLGSKAMVITPIVFLINPVLGVLLSLYWLLKSGSSSRNDYYLFFTLLALWMGGINATKEPASDQVNYLEMFESVPIVGLGGILFFWGEGIKEPIYSLFTFVSYYLTMGNSKLFFFLITFIIYQLHFVATYKILHYLKYPGYGIVAGVLIFAFFTQFFNLTTHLIRQAMAVAIVLYAISRKVEDGKNHWILLIVAYLTHSSSGFLCVLSVIPFIGKQIKKWKIILMYTGFTIFFTSIVRYANIFIGKDFTDSGLLTHGINRLARGGDEGEVSLALYLLVIIPLLLIAILNIFVYRRAIGRSIMMFHLCSLICLFVLSLFDNTLLQYRFFYYTYSFIPIVLPLAFKTNSVLFKSFCVLLPLFMITRFWYTFDDMPWTYAPIYKLLMLPFPFLLI